MSRKARSQRAVGHKPAIASAGSINRPWRRWWAIAAGVVAVGTVTIFLVVNWINSRHSPAAKKPTIAAAEASAKADSSFSASKPSRELASATTGTPPMVIAISGTDRGPDSAPTMAYASEESERTADLSVTAKFAVLRDEAIAIGRQMLRDFPGSSDAYGLLGMTYNRMNKPAQAMKYWELAAEANPTRADVYEAMATAAITSGDFAKAASLCREGLARSNKLSGLYASLGEALNGLNKPTDTVEELEPVVKQFPKDAQLRSELGRAHLLLKDYARAKGFYEAAVELKPDSRPALHGLAVANQRLGNEQAARDAMQRYQRSQADFDRKARASGALAADLPGIRRLLAMTCADAGQVYYARGDYDRAKTLWRRGIEVDSDFTTCRIQLATCYLRLGQTSRAAPLIDELTRIEPANAEFFQKLAVVRDQLGDRAAALAAATKAAELSPDDPGVKKLLEKLRQ